MVLGLIPYESDFIDCAVTTESRSGDFGKFWALRRHCGETARIWHVDDNVDVCWEIGQSGEERFRAAGIKVPNHWRSQRQLDIFWHQNVLNALDVFIGCLKDLAD